MKVTVTLAESTPAIAGSNPVGSTNPGFYLQDLCKNRGTPIFLQLLVLVAHQPSFGLAHNINHHRNNNKK